MLRLLLFGGVMTNYILAYMYHYWESQKERDHWEDQDVDGWTILRWILER
jgi:hypothetical protein